ncbi:MAG TPA: hypothetical protein VK074_10225 [Fodinibius sp.]|nr:hypothetical protein [Fodinibius sp.]
MYLLIILLCLLFIAACWTGYQRLLQLKHLNRQRVLYGFLAAMLILTVLTAAHRFGFFPQYIAARVTMGLYSVIAGFFFGFASKQYHSRKKAGQMAYAHRSFWTETAPALICILLISFGIYRTQLFSFGPFTGIGITSGLSLIAFGIVGLTIRVVPEFRRKGILVLDRLVPWKKVAAYRWKSEEALQIDYLNTDGQLTDFVTAIPADDHLVIERLLSKKLAEYEEERKQEIDEINPSV